jgi:glucosamine kinase
MILIADSGSTKAEWVVAENGIARDSIFTSGINPYFLSSDEITELLRKELSPLAGQSFSKVIFYGTGCNNTEKENVVKGAIGEFVLSEDIFVGTDLLGAARSLCHNKPGIACILGTGSNSCYYNGSMIVSNVPALGYLLGDEGSGAVLGRKLISDVLKKQVSKEISDLFFQTYNLTPAEIMDSVYRKPTPNRFLGQFSKFLSANRNSPEIHRIISSSFDEFIVRNVLQYPESKQYKVHFTGSIAHYFSDELKESLKKFGLEPGTISLAPMENLIRYHFDISY